MSFDEKVITAIRNGKDDKTIKLLYQKTFPSVRKMVVEYGGDYDSANDVFQDAVIILIRKIKDSSLPIDSNIKGFLYTISKNLWLNKLKRDSKSSSFDDEDQLADDMIYEIEYHESAKEKEKVIQEIISKLDKKCAHVLHAILFTDKDYSEIAEEIGLANSNVMKVTKSRCKDKLVKLLQAEPELRNILISYNERFTRHI